MCVSSICIYPLRLSILYNRITDVAQYKHVFKLTIIAMLPAAVYFLYCNETRCLVGKDFIDNTNFEFYIK